MSRSHTKNAKLLEHLAAVRGVDRKAHFEAGGELAGWRGLHHIEVDRLQRGRRLACRQPFREDD